MNLNLHNFIILINIQADLFTGDFNPVKMREFIKLGDQVLEIGSGLERCGETLMKPDRSLPPLSATSRIIDPDGLSLLAGEVVPDHSCLVFCATKKNCESVAQLISRNPPANLLDCKKEEKYKLMKALQVNTLFFIYSQFYCRMLHSE